MMIVLWISKWSVTDYYFTFSLHSWRTDKKEKEGAMLMLMWRKTPSSVIQPPTHPCMIHTEDYFFGGGGYYAARGLISRDSTTQIVMIQIFYINNIHISITVIKRLLWKGIEMSSSTSCEVVILLLPGTR